ncbi:MAG TPA: 2-oxoacid:acceptor oxidoreductase family protein [Acidobacteriota bacterium]|nr:2-oxoacid:acceptor oxidoreductase family protein [Acidobacteriota bacterium]
MNNVINIRMSGLGGQGVVTAAHILGSASTIQGYECTVNPFFGAEKRLAPAESYVRISRGPIYERGEILKPTIIMIFHPHVITLGKCYTMPFFDGLQENGTILINSSEMLDLRQAERDRLRQLGARIFYIPATDIASQVGGTELSTNIAMLGGLLAINPLVTYENLEKAVAERFGGGKFVASGTTAALDDVVKGKYAQISQLIEKNMEVIKAAGGSLKEYQLA